MEKSCLTIDRIEKNAILAGRKWKTDIVSENVTLRR